MPPKGGLPAAERRRRAIQSARDRSGQNNRARAGPVSRQRNDGGSAPAAYVGRTAVGQPRFASIENGLRISHTEKVAFILQDADNKQVGSFPIVPASFPWLGGIAEEYSNFKFVSVSFAYKPQVGTTTPGSVTMAPYYGPNDPLAKGMNANGVLDFLNSIPGVKQFAVWAIDASGFVVSNFVRNMFQIGGITTTGKDDNASTTNDEAKIPGFIVWSVDHNGTQDTACGSLWITYTIDLISPIGRKNHPKGISLSSSSAASNNLQLTSRSVTTMSGDLWSAYPSGTNDVTFRVPGQYTVVTCHKGTSVVKGINIDDIFDRYGTNVTADRLWNVWDVGGNAFVDTTEPDNFNLKDLSTGTVCLQVYVINVQYGDYIRFGAPGGTIDETMLHIIASNGPMLLV